MEGEDIFAVVCVLGMFGAAAYHIAMQIKNGTENRRSQHRRSRAKKSMDLTFTMCPTELTAR